MSDTLKEQGEEITQEKIEEVVETPAEEPKEEESNGTPAPAADPVADALEAATKTIEKLNKKLDKITEQHEAEIQELKGKLPSVLINQKVTIEGYFDYDSRAGKMLQAEADRDYERAKADFAIIETIFR